jgi:hypothetical protein
MWTARFWLSTAERFLKTFCQTLIALWPLGDAVLGWLDVDWKKSVSLAVMAAALSVLTSIVSAPVGPDNSPSLVGEPPKQPAAALEYDDTPGEHALDGDEGEIPVSRLTPPPAPQPKTSRYRHPQQ